MNEAMEAAWRKLKAAIKHIEEALGYTPSDDSGEAAADGAQPEVGSDGPPPGTHG